MFNRVLGHVEIIREGITTAMVRNQVISNNIANAETPGYLAKELKPVEFSSYLETEKNSSNNNAINY
jgi:flagellar basal-body rod protein FlgB